MNRTLTTLATVAVALGAAPALAAAADDPSPPQCRLHLQATYRQAAVLEHGLPVRVTCDGPGTFLVAMDYADRRTGDWIRRHYGDSGDPGSEAFTRETTADGAGTTTVRLRFKPWSPRMARAFPSIRMWFVLYVKDEQGRLRGTDLDHPYARLVR
jgi:hypothetical protein